MTSHHVITPGPVFSSATFVGIVIAGLPRVVLATVAIFGPASFSSV